MAAAAVYGSALDLASRLGVARALNAPLVMLPTIVAFYAAVALCERVAPYRREWNEPQGDVRTDLVYLLVAGPAVSALAGATVQAGAFAGAALVSERLGATLWPTSWPIAAQLFLAILVAEFGHYWFHRLSHENPWVWRLHATHHSAPRLYWLNATRFHPLDLFCLIACQSVPLILLGAPPRAFLAYSLFAAVYGQLQHGNVAFATWPFDRLLSTPGLHRFHHATTSREGNTNYGAILITWDVVFGSFFRPRDRAFEGPVGIGKLPRFPQRFAAQLASPFRWRRVVEESAAR